MVWMREEGRTGDDPEIFSIIKLKYRRRPEGGEITLRPRVDCSNYLVEHPLLHRSPYKLAR